MKILIVGSGQSFHATRWANSLAERGMEICFFSVNTIERPLSSKVKVYTENSRLGRISYFLYSVKLRKVINSFRPDIVHAHYSSGNGILASLALLGTNTKFITSLYGAEVYDFPKKSRLHYLILKLVTDRADRVLSTSNAMAREFLNDYPMSEKVTVTPFGVDTAIFKPMQRLEADRAVFRIGIVKKLEDKYGVDVLIRAVSKLKKELQTDKSLELVIVGGGSKKNELEKLVRDLKLGDCVRFVGWVDNKKIPQLLNSFDVFAVPSRHESESFGVAAVEAQSCCIPIIVSDVGGLPEVVIENVTGYVVLPDSVDALHRKLKYIFENPTIASELGLNGRRHVLKTYDWNECLDLMTSIYLDVKRQS